MSVRRVLCVLVAGGALVWGGTSAAVGQTPVQDSPPVCGEVGSGGGERDGALRVATYNILHSQDDLADASMDVRIEAIADELVSHEVDVVGMQEVVWSANHGAVAQRVAAAVAERTARTWWWCTHASNPHCAGEPDTATGGRGGPCSQAVADNARSGDSDWYEGVAVVSRYPIASATAHRLVGRAQEIPFCLVEADPLCAPTMVFDTRTVVHARIDTPWGGLDHFTSHLANGESPQTELTRQLQVTDALVSIDTSARNDLLPDLYVGDFNTDEGSPVWQAVIDAGFVDGFRAAEPTAEGFTAGQVLDAPHSTVDRRIDYVFVRDGGCAVEPRDAALLGDEPITFQGAPLWPSDHYGVALTLRGASRCLHPATAVVIDGDGGGADHVAAAGRPVLPATGGGRVLAGTMVLALALAVARARRGA